MALTCSAITPEILTADEYQGIDEDVRIKLESYVKKLSEDRLVASALLETFKLNSEQSIASLEHVVEEKVCECQTLASKLEIASNELESFKAKSEELQNEVSCLREQISRLETENNSFKLQRNTAIDERDDLLKIVERRNSELQNLQEDYRSLSSQLQAAIAAKCEALVKSEEIESLRLNLEFKEKRLESERDRMVREIESLTAELNRAVEEKINCRKESTTRRLTLETQLNEKIEEEKIAQQTLEGLEETNAKLQAKLEESLRKLMAQHETELKLQKTFDEEIKQQTKLTELYKAMSEDANSKAVKLEKGIKELQDLLRESVEQNEKTEVQMKLLIEQHDRQLNEKDQCIEKIKQELKSANDLMELVREDKKMECVEDLSPAAANVMHLFNSRMTLTQLYMQMKEISQDLIKERQENKRLNECMDAVLQEIEAKAPELQKLRNDHASMVDHVSKMCQTLDASTKEIDQLSEEMKEHKKLKEQYERENERLRKEMVDLSRQICYLLKENQDLHNNDKNYSMDAESCEEVSSSSRVITQHLVTFSSIQELQKNNLKLIALVRELSEKAEEEEGLGPEKYEELKMLLDIRTKELEEYKEKQARYNKMMERAMKQLQYFKGKMDKSDSYNEESLMDVTLVAKSPEKHPATPRVGGTSCDIHDEEIAELNEKLQNTMKSLEELQEETDIYRTERQTNERMLTDQIESMRNEIRELRTNCNKMTSQLDYSEERFKIMQANCNTYKTQIAALESRNKNYNTTIVKQEQTLNYLQDEVISAQKKLAVAEVALENARGECALLRDSEARLQREREALHRDQHGQALLMANLDTIRASLERSEVEVRARLESRLDESLRECGALRRRLQEEQDRFRELSHHLERQTEAAKSRQEEEAKLAERYKEELEVVKEELIKAKSTIDELNRRTGESNNSIMRVEKNERLGAIEQELKETKVKLKCLETELQGTKELLTNEKEHTKQFSEVSESLELKLSDVTEEYNRHKENSEKRVANLMQREEELLKKVSALESRLSSIQIGSTQSSAELSVQLKKTQDDLHILQEELDKTKHDLANARMEVASLSASAQAAEDKYAHEVVMHSTDVQNLLTVKKELAEVAAEVKELRAAKASAEQALEEGKENWEEREAKLQKELLDTQQRISDLDEHNAKLYEQLEELGSKVAVLHAQGVQQSPNTSFSEDSGNKSLNTSFSEDEVKSSDQLMQIIKYLRREKNIAVSRYDVLKAENMRLSSQLESIKKQLNELKSNPEGERERSDIAVLTTSKHAELLRKLETLSALTDSNRMLRSERDALQAQVKECTLRVESLEQELGPLREQNRDLTARVDSLDAENVALRGEAGRLRSRVNFLIERSSKTSPEDWRRLQQERETLARQVASDRETIQRKDEEARNLRQDKARMEEQVNALTRQQQLQSEELKRQAEELNTMHQRLNKVTQELNDAQKLSNKKNEELAKITEDLGAKEALLTDVRNKEMQIRKIAKKYKTQYEELTKTSEEDKKKMEVLEKSLSEAQASASALGNDVAPEIQEQFREEGRREVEIRIVEVESRHSDRVKELVGQVTSSHEEAENLRKENDTLKSTAATSNERAKQVLQNARQKIMLLTDAKVSLQKELDEMKNRLQAAEQGQEEDTVRMSALKSQYENRIARLEKENADVRSEKQHEVETLNQRINQLQRQLEKLQQGSKPTTSSGPGEKVSGDPPTANIKPMAGPSSSGVKQAQSQQSVSLTPWAGRGDTPFASIRPMSMQSRTAAVLPTSQSASSTISPAIPVLVPPQQQLVHTTGTGGSGGPEGLSSSPTSSHTDYIPTMPATSSAGNTSSLVRQVAVPPTVTTVTPSTRDDPPQSAQSVAESTQDIEAEPVMTDVSPQTGTHQQQQPPPTLRQQTDHISQHKVEPQIQVQVQQQSSQQPQQLQQQQPQHQSQPIQLQNQSTSATQQISQIVAPSTQQGQQAVAMVLPRVEQLPAVQQISGQPQQVEQAAAAPSSQASSSSNTVTTSQAGIGTKRAREPEIEETENNGKTQGKRSRMTGSGQQDMFPVSSDSALEVEYQVPTSSQRDQEDEMVDSEEEEGIADEGVIEEPDDGQEFDEDDNGEGYTVQGYRDEQDLTSFEEVEGHDIDEENPADPENNEAEIMDDSNEVPNQSGTDSPARPAGEASVRPPSNQQQHAEASSSGTTSGGSIEIGCASTAGVGTSRVASSVMGFGRGPARSVPPLTRQQQQTQLLLGYEESGDDSIVPSTPTLFVPRRSDGFGEAVSSPQVPQQTRFTFSDTSTPTARSGISQGNAESIDDNRMDLNQLEEAGTGRSVPTTPPQVSPQEMSSEVEQSEGSTQEAIQQDNIQSEPSGSQTSVPSITVTEASEDDTAETGEEMPPPELTEYDESGEQREGEQEQEEIMDLADEGGDGVSSEGEKSQPLEEDEGREAEATEAGDAQEAPRRVTRAANTARRSVRNAFRGQRGRGNMRPTPIIWNEPGSSMSSQTPRGRACLIPSMRGNPNEGIRGTFHRGNQRGRRSRGKPKGNFQSPYQMRF